MKKPQHSESFEHYITKISVFLALVPSSLLVIFLYQASISLYLKIIITLFFTSVLAIGHIFIWRRIRNQLRTTTNIVESLITGDSTMRPNSAIKTGALAELNQVLNLASQQLAEQRLLSKEHHIAMSKVLEYINIAVITLDEHDVITLLNPKAKQLFHIQDEMIGLPVKTLGIDNKMLQGKIQHIVTLTTDKIQKRVYLQTDSYLLNHKKHTLLFFNDVQKLLQDEERSAWQRLLRVLSHEINNSLAPIASIGESLSAIVNKDNCPLAEKSDIANGLAIMTQRALTLDSFIKQYQTLTRLPPPTKTLFSLSLLLKQQLALFPDLQVIFAQNDPIEIYADSEQIAQVLVNLLKNARQAMADSESPTINIKQQISGEYIQLQLIDNGCGISNPDNLFIPYYTTKKSGSGIGLVLSRQILFNHGGDLSLANTPENNGAVATLLLPNLVSP